MSSSPLEVIEPNSAPDLGITASSGIASNGHAVAALNSVTHVAAAGVDRSLRPADHSRRIGDRPTPRSTVSLVIPARNEARNLAIVLENLPSCVDEVILVDGSSSDVTKLMALSCCPDIQIINEPARGKGHALRAGFDAAQCDVVIAMDADGSMLPHEIPRILFFLDHGYDFVKGSRFIGGGGSLDISLIRKLGNRGLLMIANWLFDVQLTDLCYGYFGFRRKYLAHLGLISGGFEIETELTVRAITSGLRIAEVPSVELPRRSGRSNLRSVRDGIRVLRILLRERAGKVVRALPPTVLAEPAA
jgi:glycosyltransferase involved in cell wall biosynthesis